jgi:predicted nucleic acid-binding protein
VNATALLRAGIADDSIRVPHQALVEFVAAVSKPMGRGVRSILSPEHARREVEEMFGQFEVLYPDDTLLRTAVRGAATYGLSWFDAHIWAYAECYGLETIWSEDFEHGRRYGRVRVVDPFL